MKKFLIVVDMQRDFVDGALGTPEAQAIVAGAVEKILHFDGEIIATLDTHGADYLQTSEGRKLPVPHCIRGTDGWKLDARVAAALEQRGYTAIEKPSFGSLELPEAIRRSAPDGALDIELIGLCTDICVVSNALILKAHFPEAEIHVDPSCCAGVTHERHRAALATMQSCQIDA